MERQKTTVQQGRIVRRLTLAFGLIILIFSISVLFVFRELKNVSRQMDDEVQIHTNNELKKAETQTYQSVKKTLYMFAVLLIGGIGIGIVSAFFTVKGVVERRQNLEQIEALSKFPSENPNPVMRISGNGSLKYSNNASKALLETWHYKEGQQIWGEPLGMIKTVLQSDEPKSLEAKCQDKIYSVTFAPVTDMDYANVYALDITDRKQAEDELKNTLSDLQQSNKELEQFVYIASHDLQEPLRMVSSYTQLLEHRYKDKLDDDATDFINYAVDGAVRMQLLINDLLSYSRLGVKDKKFELVDCQQVLSEVITNLKVTINENSALITNHGLPQVNGDHSLITRLFQNLITNAIKYRSDFAPVIQISAEKQNDKWRFSVSDNGIGFEPEYKDKIFEIFQRLHGKDEYSGTGMGLTICKKIVDRHGGKIWAESELGNGAIFYFTIPTKP